MKLTATVARPAMNTGTSSLPLRKSVRLGTPTGQKLSAHSGSLGSSSSASTAQVYVLAVVAELLGPRRDVRRVRPEAPALRVLPRCRPPAHAHLARGTAPVPVAPGPAAPALCRAGRHPVVQEQGVRGLSLLARDALRVRQGGHHAHVACDVPPGHRHQGLDQVAAEAGALLHQAGLQVGHRVADPRRVDAQSAGRSHELQHG
eukprot:CAMPEP_0119137866 /NCGR_PEP_ID=MMETSP1310-20130426/24558_1 /TAXON_ID=464262 /ORGANISM="Genus nov. species nov., Strain RCC2339" /LENGTH=202 /DNA_ID=CAMNT_0007129003 /DNA_START=177 /DNA_END=781 /DNA_ORIENTATION=-